MSWDNREGKAQSGLIAFLLIWASAWTPMSLYVTHTAIEDGWTAGITVGVVLCWLGLLLVPLNLMRKLCVESVTLDEKRICHRLRWHGLSLGTVSVPIDKLDSLELARESAPTGKTLTLHAGWRKVMLAYATGGNAKAEIFDALVPVLQEHKPDVQLYDYRAGTRRPDPRPLRRRRR